MGVKYYYIVWEASKHAGSHLITMLRIADHANDQGDGSAWPGSKTLARYVRVSERQVNRILKELVASGELEALNVGHGPGNHAGYRITLTLDDVPRKGDMGVRYSGPGKPDMGVRYCADNKPDIQGTKPDIQGTKPDIQGFCINIPEPEEPEENHEETADAGASAAAAPPAPASPAVKPEKDIGPGATAYHALTNRHVPVPLRPMFDLALEQKGLEEFNYTIRCWVAVFKPNNYAGQLDWLLRCGVPKRHQLPRDDSGGVQPSSEPVPSEPAPPGASARPVVDKFTIRQRAAMYYEANHKAEGYTRDALVEHIAAELEVPALSVETALANLKFD